MATVIGTGGATPGGPACELRVFDDASERRHAPVRSAALRAAILRAHRRDTASRAGERPAALRSGDAEQAGGRERRQAGGLHVTRDPCPPGRLHAIKATARALAKARVIKAA